MKKIELLKKIGVVIPKGAVCFTTTTDSIGDAAIVFQVNDWPEGEQHYQGK